MKQLTIDSLTQLKYPSCPNRLEKPELKFPTASTPCALGKLGVHFYSSLCTSARSDVAPLSSRPRARQSRCCHPSRLATCSHRSYTGTNIGRRSATTQFRLFTAITARSNFWFVSTDKRYTQIHRQLSSLCSNSGIWKQYRRGPGGVMKPSSRRHRS